MKNLAVGIVLYNPNIGLLEKNIKELNKICKKIYLVNNGSSNSDSFKKNILKSNITLIENKKNLGIAEALNQILKKSYSDNMDYLLTLDQDSYLESDMVMEMLKYIDMDDVAIACPIINDLNKDKPIIQEEEYTYLDRCITSGSLMNLKVCKKIGYFKKEMFIDYVDFDYCKRIQLAGKKIIRVKRAVINHEIGKRTKRKFLFFTVYPTNHNKNRIYYYSRNMKYYYKKYKKQMTFKERLNEKIRYYWKFLSIILYEENKKEKINCFFIGIKDSKKLI